MLNEFLLMNVWRILFGWGIYWLIWDLLKSSQRLCLLITELQLLFWRKNALQGRPSILVCVLLLWETKLVSKLWICGLCHLRINLLTFWPSKYLVVNLKERQEIGVIDLRGLTDVNLRGSVANIKDVYWQVHMSYSALPLLFRPSFKKNHMPRTSKLKKSLALWCIFPFFLFCKYITRLWHHTLFNIRLFEHEGIQPNTAGKLPLILLGQCLSSIQNPHWW